MPRKWIAIILMLAAGCTRDNYTLTINTISPDKSTAIKTQKIYAANDSSAYAQAAVMFYLALHAYNRTAEESKPFVTQPVSFEVADHRGNDVDSVLGAEITKKIKQEKEKAIN